MVKKSDIDMLNRKIYSIRKVGKECFADVVEFNFLNNPKYREDFKSPFGAKEILLRFSALTEKNLFQAQLWFSLMRCRNVRRWLLPSKSW